MQPILKTCNCQGDWEAYAKKIEHDLRQRIAELEEERYALIHQNCKDAHRIKELEAKLKRQNNE